MRAELPKELRKIANELEKDVEQNEAAEDGCEPEREAPEIECLDKAAYFRGRNDAAADAHNTVMLWTGWGLGIGALLILFGFGGRR